MKKARFCVLAVILVTVCGALTALDLGQGFSLGGGVKTGLLIKNSDYSGSLNGINLNHEYPFTLYFASRENETYKGEGWLNFAYDGENWGVHLGAWSHGNLTNYNDAFHLGDHYLWGAFFNDRFRFFGGQGGGTPISSGGWLNADWLGYTGLRLFWVDPLGFSLGINFVDPDDGNTAEGIKPVDYLTMIMFGAKYNFDEKFWLAVMVDNNPIYDDSEADYDGGLHRDPDARPIGQAGNIAYGIGIKNFIRGAGEITVDGIVANIGEDDRSEYGSSSSYKLSPITNTIALKAGYPFIEKKLYTELKAKYFTRQGDNEDLSAPATWGLLEFEPYISYKASNLVKFETAFNAALYVNSYYLAEDVVPTAGPGFIAGQVPKSPGIGEYASTYRYTVKPAVIFTFMGATTILGYNGTFSRDHVENAFYIDFRFAF
jgi:hypothetical protein